MLLKQNNAAVIVSQQQLEEEGIDWWEKFVEERCPGEFGRRLNQMLPNGGTKDFAKLILEIYENSSKWN